MFASRGEADGGGCAAVGASVSTALGVAEEGDAGGGRGGGCVRVGRGYLESLVGLRTVYKSIGSGRLTNLRGC